MKKILVLGALICFGFAAQAADQVSCSLWYAKTGSAEMINPFTTQLKVDLKGTLRTGKNVADGTTLLTLVFEKGTFSITHLNLPTKQKNITKLSLQKDITYGIKHKLTPQRVDGHDVDTTYISCALD